MLSIHGVRGKALSQSQYWVADRKNAPFNMGFSITAEVSDGESGGYALSLMLVTNNLEKETNSKTSKYTDTKNKLGLSRPKMSKRNFRDPNKLNE